MAETIVYLAAPLFLFLFLAHQFYRTKRSQSRNLPPSPPRLPFLGHVHLLKPPMHRVFHNLAQKYGPIFYLQFGSRRVVVVSSTSTIEECFNKNDVILANRPKLLVTKHVGYNNTAMDVSQYGEYWRNLRRIATVELLSNHRLSQTVNIRNDELKRLITKLSSESLQGFAKVELQSAFQDLSFNIVMRLITGKRYFGDDVTDVKEANEFKQLLFELPHFFDPIHLGDYFPLWNWFNFGRYESKLMDVTKRIDTFMQNILDECRSNLHRDNMKTLAHSLLFMQKSEPEFLTDEKIKANLLGLLFAGSDVTSVALEWAMACILKYPNVLRKARHEIDSIIGQTSLLDESDVPKLRYLENVISETHRLYPAEPVIDPHVASDDCIVGGYVIPRGAVVLANAWTVHRDPKIWDDPDTFRPERFDGELDVRSSLIPFGMGRRSCPGRQLASRILGLTLGTLIQCFDWKNISDDEDIDMTARIGITTPKIIPLEAMCRPRPVLHNNYTYFYK
ncbi:hypothetical protein K2173_021322 [Erythroxylum novogranatense]|uniref:Cytochrome P450 n=1 Tax=Erythroxylum novogranatense TaxID=1862640 RepID=A0AAV8TWX5_9ROSI|nr:hypothetical protein K2173_021322 [Erythroxylum novogranatense]